MLKPLIFFAICFAILAGGGLEASASSDRLQVHGFVSQGFLLDSENYLTENSKRGTFDFFEAGINFGIDVTDRLGIGMQLLSRKYLEYGNYDVTIDWACGDYNWREWLGIRAGLLKVPFGLYNETRDIDMLRTQILLPEAVYPEMFREELSSIKGGGIYGALEIPLAGLFEYQVLVGQLSISDNFEVMPAYTDLVAQDFGIGSDLSFAPSLVGQLIWHTPVQGLLVSGTTINISLDVPYADDQVAVFDSDLSVFSLQFTKNEFVVSAEYLYFDWDTRFSGMHYAKVSDGFYASVAYQFCDWFEMGAYYSQYYLDNDDRNGDNFIVIGLPDHRAWQKDLALSLCLNLGAHSTFKLEGHLKDGTTQISSIGINDEFPAEWYLFSTKLTFYF